MIHRYIGICIMYELIPIYVKCFRYDVLVTQI